MRGFTYFVAAATAAIAFVGCTVHQTEAPAITGPSDLALSISVTTSPQSIVQNGNDASVVTAKVYFTDPATGQTKPKANLPIRFDMQVGGVAQDFGTLSARSAVTDANGLARTRYTAPAMPAGGNSGTCNGVPGTCITIIATVSDTSAANSATTGYLAPGSATILLTPPGVILPPAGTPKASFTMLPNSNLLVGTSVTFDASASCPTDPSGACSSSGSIRSYDWNFGDGGAASGKTVTYTFSTAGTFVVTLTVTSDRGLAQSTSQTATIGLPAAPVADFVFSPSAPVAGQLVFFNGDISKSTPGHPIVQYSWNYGDGKNDSGITVSHAFAESGTYIVVLSVLDDVGQKSSKSTQVTVAGSNPTAKLTVTKAGGNKVTADGSLSTAVTGSSVSSYSFNFGDGTGTSTASATPTMDHTYAVAGSYTVTLIVTDSAGRTGTASASITVP